MKTMKTFAIAFLLMIGGATVAQNPRSGDTVYLQVTDIDPTGGDGGYERGPVRPLAVTLDGHTLYTSNLWFDAVLQLLDEEENNVYTTFIPANTSSIILPATLCGNYELRLFPGGDYYFYGWIVL